MENINWICKSRTVNNNIVWMCHPKVKEHFESTGDSVITLAQHCDNAGWKKTLGVGTFSVSDFPADASYITVPAGLSATLTTGSGQVEKITGPNVFNFCSKGDFNDNVKKIVVESLNSSPVSTGPSAQLFSAANYEGNTSSFGIGRYTNSQLQKIGPKALQSIKVPSGLVALIYQNADFTGYGKAISADTPDLSKVTDTKNTGFNWSNQMQSLIVQPYVALPTSISDSMPKISLVAPDPNSFITAVSGAVLTRIDDKSYLYVDPNNKDNIFWYNASDLQIIPPFSIGAISDLQLWFDGRDPAANGSQPADGSKLSNWNDKSNNKFNTTNVNGNPIYNKNGVVFDGNSYYNLPDGSIPFNDSSYSVYVVGNITNSGGVPGMIGGGNVNGPTGAWLAITGHQNRNFETAWNNRNIQSGCQYNENQTFLHYSLYESGGQRSIGFNGTVCKTDTPSGPRVQPNNNNVLGWASQNIGKMNGSISEVLVFNTSHSDSQRQIVEGYLAWKWGLQSSLPGNHPFKSAAPSGSTAFPKLPKFFTLKIEKISSSSQVQFLSMTSDAKNIIAQGNDLPTVLSTDYGKTWKKIHTLPDAERWSYQGPILISDQGQILINTVNNGSYFSSDLGNNWKEVGKRTQHCRIPACSKDGKIWYLPYYPHEIWKSTDSGNSFKPLPRIPGNGGISCVSCTDDGNTVYMCTAGGYDGHLYKSTDGGNNFTKINKEKNPRGGGLEGNGTWDRVFCSSDGTIVLGVNMDPIVLMVSSDSGNTWNDINPPGNRVSPFAAIALSKDGSTIVIGCSQPKTLLKSTNLGKTWTQLPKTELEGTNDNYFNLALSKDGSTLAVGLGNLCSVAILS